MSEQLNGLKRTNYCGEIDEINIGQTVAVMGWANKQRDKGGLVFIDLRDRTGLVQLTFDDNTNPDVFEKATTVRAEYVIAASGTVRARGEGAVNEELATGRIEIAVDELKILSASATPPFHIASGNTVKEELRLKHRYLDLRRADMQKNIIERAKIVRLIREFFYKEGFIDIETPNLIKPTPEGARDYLVPSRVHPGKFYALPQSPQIYKQILMLSGFDKYIQLARCFRDEDLRIDRQPEFTQVDMELSFVEQDDVINLLGRFFTQLFKDYLNEEIAFPFPVMTYKECMETYGSDKPDTRYDLKLTNLTDTVKDCSFAVFADCVAGGGSVFALNVKGAAEKLSRKEIDALGVMAKACRAKGLAWYKNSAEPSSSYAKNLQPDENAKIFEAVKMEAGDLILIVADRGEIPMAALGNLRIELANKLGLIPEKKYAFLTVTEFPMFERDLDTDEIIAKHHPFTSPMDEDVCYLETEPEKVRAKAYDIVLNGWELGSGSIRIHSQEMQAKIFEVLGLSPEQIETKFGFFIEALKYGTPPHGGFGFGLDRLCTLMLGLTAIRDVIAFPKVQNASELMSSSPSIADANALADLKISVDAEIGE